VAKLRALVVGAVLGVALAGCGGPPLTRDQQVQMLMARDRRCQQQLLAAQQQVADLAAAGAKPAASAPAPEDPFRPVAIRFSSYSGVVDAGGPVDQERLKVVLEPIDASGDVVKRAGSLVIEAFEPGPAGAPPRPYHRWEFSLPEMRETWLSGLGAYAYILRLRWPDNRPPAGEKLVLRAAFTTLAAEVLAAEAEVPLPNRAAGAKP